MAEQAKKPLWRRIVRRTIDVVLICILLAIFYLAVVMGQPQDDTEAKTDMNQPLTAAAPSLAMAKEQEVIAAAEGFPIPVLCASAGSGLVLNGGSCYDAPFENGVARIMSLSYTDAAGHALQVNSIYPARALTLLTDSQYTLVGQGPALAGAASVRMNGKGTIRLHAQTTDGLYMVTTQTMEPEELTEMLRPLQLLGGQ